MTDAPDFDVPPSSRDQMLDKAWRRVARALDAGHATEAMRWMRVHSLLTQAERAEGRERDRTVAQDMRDITRNARNNETRAVATLRQLQAESPFTKGEVHTVHSKKSPPVSSKPPDPEDPGLSRAERRRRLKYREKARSPP